MIRYIYFFTFILFLSVNSYCSGNKISLSNVLINIEDNVSIKRGANIFFNYCQGCHSLKYMRYSDLASGINIVGAFSKSFEDLIHEYFMHSTKSINENSQIFTSITKDMGIKWFGKVPPDLSLIVRYRGVEWIYSYMLAFYKDASRPWGVNNLVFPDVGMPHVLLNFQGVRVLKEENNHVNLDGAFISIEDGMMSDDKYKFMIKDLVTFLAYVSEPTKASRETIGLYIIIYFIILSIILYFIKKSYWKDIK